MLAPDKQVGANFNIINVTLGGVDSRFDRPYVMYMWNEGGFGGGPDRDGGDAPTQAMFATGCRNQPIEVHERAYPIRYTKLEIAQDSAGAGKWRGCPGIHHSYALQDESAVIGVFGDRKVFKPWGVEGGAEGSGQNLWINHGLAGERDLGLAGADIPVKHHDVVEVWTSGGGGCGNALERDPEMVLRDVQRGFVSERAAREIYGVAVECVDALRAEWRIDEAATAQLRSGRP
jgi:N-methylhydantoinase B